MLDRYNRHIGYVRISVTDRCNLRCSYCMPADGVACKHHNDILSDEEICAFVEAVVPLGITKVRLTGGEPLVRKGIVGLVGKLSGIDGITDLSMTTNGILLAQYAQLLKDAGLHRLNVSLDTLDADKYREVTRGGNLQDVLQGIQVAGQVGFSKIKINSVYFESSSPKDKAELLAFCQKENLELRFIYQMDLKTGEFSIVEGGEGGNCSKCNRIRLTSNGMVKPCLFSDLEFPVRELGVVNAIRQAVDNKPCCGTKNTVNEFYAIGG